QFGPGAGRYGLVAAPQFDDPGTDADSKRRVAQADLELRADVVDGAERGPDFEALRIPAGVQIQGTVGQLDDRSGERARARPGIEPGGGPVGEAQGRPGCGAGLHPLAGPQAIVWRQSGRNRTVTGSARESPRFPLDALDRRDGLAHRSPAIRAR